MRDDAFHNVKQRSSLGTSFSQTYYRSGLYAVWGIARKGYLRLRRPRATTIRDLYMTDLSWTQLKHWSALSSLWK